MYKLIESEISEKKLSQWIIKGDLEKIKAYFTTNPTEIKNKLPYDQDLVTFSIYANQEKIFDWLLSNGAKAGADKKGFTPLHQAAISPNPYYVGKLVKFGLDINRSNKKTGSPLATVIDFIKTAKNGVGGSLTLVDKLKRAEDLKDTFKELIKYGADVHGSDIYGDKIFIHAVKYGLTPFVKIMLDKDKSLLKQKLVGYSVLTIAMSNYRDDIVALLIDEDFDLEFIDVKVFIVNTPDTDLAMRLYNNLSEPLKSQLQIEKMLYIQNGKEKLLRLLERGVKITDDFVKDTRVREIAEELMNSSRGTEIAALGVKNGITEFLPQVAKDIFLF